jgi:glucose-1-phosphate cytidylyltransferase
MKVVLFCGGEGMRMKDHSDAIPKPMVSIGNRPLLWNVMKYYAHFGFKDFILCLGYKAEYIKNYFLNYNEYLANDFTLSKGGKDLTLYNSDIDDWNITFADTGARSCVGERLRAVKKYLEGEEYFLANYSDGLTNFNIHEMINFVKTNGKMAGFLSARTNQSFHVVDVHKDGAVKGINPIAGADIWINVGYFMLHTDIFDYLKPGDELVHEAFNRLIGINELVSMKYEGFWCPMDTFKDKQYLEKLSEAGNPPWEVWNNAENGKNK